MSAIGSEMYTGLNSRSDVEQRVVELAMWALCGDAPDHIVPPEYAHFRNTALEFVSDHLRATGVTEMTIIAGLAQARSQYDKQSPPLAIA